MSIKLGINGFGRIGKHLLRLALDSKEIEVVAVNDIADIKTCSQLLKYDSVFGILDKSVNFDDDGLDIDGKRVKFFSERSPDNIDWSSQNCQIIVESTGIFTSQEQASMHLSLIHI